MVVTRSQAAAEERSQNLRVYEDFPASPSGDASVSALTYQRTAPAPAPAPAPATATERTATATAPPTGRNAPPRPTTSRAAPVHEATRAPTVRSQRSTASGLARIRQAEFEAEERLAEIQRKELEIQTMLVKKRLAMEVATIREETDRESVIGLEDTVEAEHRVSDWLQQHAARGETEESERVEHLETGREMRRHSPRRQNIPERHIMIPGTPNRVTFEQQATRRPRSPTPTRSRDRAVDRLADTIERMARNRAPPRQTQDLPLFSGAVGEWLPFKAAWRESANLHGFSASENLARLRACLRGEARQSVSALLYAATEPSTIIRTLEQCYGRPEMIVENALEDIKKLPRLGASAVELNSFAIKVQNIVTVIMCLDEREYLRNPMFARQVAEKFGPHLKSKWCDYVEDFGSRNEPEICTLSRFLMKEADRAMRHVYTASSSGTTRGATNARTEQQPRANERNRGAVYATTEDSTKKNVCLCCGAEHGTTQCGKLKAMTVDKRWEWAKEMRICFRCLNSKHRRFHCKSKQCGVGECRQSHHALLHAAKEREVATKPTEKEESVVTAAAHVSAGPNEVLLKVCPITVKGRSGKSVHTYALLDEGSTITLVDEEIAGIVGAQGPTRALHIHGVTSSQREPDSRVVELEIKGHNQENYQPIRARTVKNLTLGSQTVRTELLQHAHLREFDHEAVCYTHAKPRILIGADNWHLIVTRKLLSGRKNQPAASLTRLGWIIHGTVPRSVIQRGETVLHVHTLQCKSDEHEDDLDKLVKAHFDIDALGVSLQRKPRAEDERAMKILENTVKRVNGRFEVGLPWANDDFTMPPSYDMAVRRLRGIERKMDRSPEFQAAYTEQVTKLLEKGYAEPCEEDHDSDPRLWYLPHFAVTNPNKPNKTRMVFDAAARTNGTCLNDVLLDGPDLLQTLYGVLFRFRIKPIAVTADVREMFLQVKIRPEDRVAQHFLWRGKDRVGPPRKYVMTSMIFGARSSPFLAHSVRDRNATDHRESHPLAFRAITQNHYMDDWVDSFDDEDTAKHTVAQVQEVHSHAGFELANWSSNRTQLLEKIPDENRAHAPKELAANANLYGKTLGLLWIPATDELAFNTAMHRVPEDVKNAARTPTKREALGAVMSLFDPLGVLSTYTITAKIMLQNLWKKKIGWDEPLPPEEAMSFCEWQSDLKYIADLRLPRCYDISRIAQKQLHVFCDASEQAFAAAAYWRFVRENGDVNVVLVAGKAKVAPLRAQSIPRMELQASLIGARLAAEIIKGHQTKAEVVLWSDSKTVLHWIRNDSVRYTPYVAHRLSEIAELTQPNQWRWVPTAHNVADDATRAGVTRIRSHDRWFVGPAFLHETQDRWPTETVHEPEDDEMLVAHANENPPLIDVNRFSSYERLVRAVAYVITFAEKCRRRAGGLELKHMREAERLLIRESQKESFPGEVARLAQQKSVDRTSRLYKLDPQYKKEIIRLNGRINAATVPEEMKDPPILDGAHPLTRLIIRREHEKNNHAGREQTVNNLRQQYWILRLRTTVRRILHECAWCKAKRARPAIPVKGNLPPMRLKTHTRPFAHCGVDCFGPMWVTIGRRREKRWGMLFTCLVTRAIHIELIAGLGTDSAIMALRRMAARRGNPGIYLSDNGTNFHGSDVELNKAYVEWLPALKDYALTRRVEWRYIDPGAPNQGGAWERMIKSVKNALAVTLNGRAPKEEVLATLMTEAEHTVNSRPLSHVPVEDPGSPEALTPNHFLLGTAIGLPYVGGCDAADRRTWRAAQALANMFWARWIKEYLPTLAPRGDIRREQRNIKPGDVVVIADGLLPRNVWPRGQVERVYPGSDGVVRSAEVRTRGGTFRRPVRRLIVLPIE